MRLFIASALLVISLAAIPFAAEQSKTTYMQGFEGAGICSAYASLQTPPGMNAFLMKDALAGKLSDLEMKEYQEGLNKPENKAFFELWGNRAFAFGLIASAFYEKATGLKLTQGQFFAHRDGAVELIQSADETTTDQIRSVCMPKMDEMDRLCEQGDCLFKPMKQRK